MLFCLFIRVDQFVHVQTALRLTTFMHKRVLVFFVRILWQKIHFFIEIPSLEVSIKWSNTRINFYSHTFEPVRIEVRKFCEIKEKHQMIDAQRCSNTLFRINIFLGHFWVRSCFDSLLLPFFPSRTSILTGSFVMLWYLYTWNNFDTFYIFSDETTGSRNDAPSTSRRWIRHNMWPTAFLNTQNSTQN